MVHLPVQRRDPWYSRLARAALEKLPSLRRSPSSLLGLGGLFSSFRVSRPGNAETDLEALATSPTVYAAVMARAYTLANFPLIVVRRQGDQETPVSAPWVEAVRRLLELPDPADLGAIFPQSTGEQLIAQLLADLLLPGDAYVAITTNTKGDIIGLHRLHPRLVSLEQRGGEEYYLYRPTRGEAKYYPRRTVARIPSLSWQASAQGEYSVGASAPLAHLVAAEATALEQTSTMIDQGGADVIITGKTPGMMAWLKEKVNRQAIEEALTNALRGRGGRRFFVLGGDLEMSDNGLKPADLKAPELMAAARTSSLAALGTMPIVVGATDTNFATAALQFRVQYTLDEALVGRLEAHLFRPLAQHFAKQAGGHSAIRASQYTARLDLGSHPGQAYIRTDAVERMVKIKSMGWTAAQAAAIERMEWPAPEGQADPVPATLPPSSGSPEPTPVGDGPGASPSSSTSPRTLGQIFKRSAMEDPSLVRERAWRAVEERRSPADRGLESAARSVLEAERAYYAAGILRELEAAVEHVQPRSAARAAPRYLYAPVNVESILGDVRDAIARWTDGLSPTWTTSWIEGMTHALDGTGFVDEVPTPTITERDYTWLEASAAAAADYSRERVRAIVTAGLDEGLSPSTIADQLSDDQGFSRARGLRVARTEAVRSQSVGTLARYSAAEEMGLDVEQEWMSDPTAALFERHHELLDGETKPVGEFWQFASGIATTGPGLSGDPGEDCNCRCAVRPKVARRTA